MLYIQKKKKRENTLFDNLGPLVWKQMGLLASQPLLSMLYHCIKISGRLEQKLSHENHFVYIQAQ